jgi:hypothetical protein
LFCILYGESHDGSINIQGRVRIESDKCHCPRPGLLIAAAPEGPTPTLLVCASAGAAVVGQALLARGGSVILHGHWRSLAVIPYGFTQ